VKAPPALAYRLSQIGLVERALGESLRASLKPGQRLVSREGDLWRWDGFTRKAEAPSAAARRLSERNRLDEIEAQALEAKRIRDGARATTEAAMKALRAAEDLAGRQRDNARQTRLKRDSKQQHLQREMRLCEEMRAKMMALDARITTLTSDETEAQTALQALVAHQAAMPPEPDAQTTLLALRQTLAEARAEAAQTRSDESHSRRGNGLENTH
jgi:chromosome segregation protein